MRLTAVTRVLNEEDIVEPFIRHHAAFVGAHILLDNGSADRTLDILASLRREGFNLAVYQNASPVFVEPIYNTALLRAALEGDAPDWVLFLDCDEFIDDRAAPGGLVAALRAAPPEAASVELPMLDYLAATDATASALNCVERLVLRQPEPELGPKVFVRRPPDPERLAMPAGGHFLRIDNLVAPGPRLDGVHLAHFPERSIAQFAAKAIIGRLKVMATGKEGATLRWNAHYDATFDALRADPAAWLGDAEAKLAQRAASGRLVHDPVAYRGGDLAYTVPHDPLRHAVSAILRHAESLATAYGRLMDGVPAAGQRVVAEASSFTRVL